MRPHWLKTASIFDYVARDSRPTMLAFVMRGTAKTGSRYSFYIDATAYDGPWPFPAEWPKGAHHLHVGSVAAIDARHGAIGARGAGCSAPARDNQLRSEHPPSRDSGSRTPSRSSLSTRSRWRIWSRLARRTSSGSIQSAALRRSSPPGQSPARNFVSRQWGSAARSPCSARNASRFRRRMSRWSTLSARATASCPRSCRRWTATRRSEPRPPRHLGANSKGGSALRRRRLQSPARARARTHRRARKSRRRLRQDWKFVV